MELTQVYAGPRRCGKTAAAARALGVTTDELLRSIAAQKVSIAVENEQRDARREAERRLNAALGLPRDELVYTIPARDAWLERWLRAAPKG